MANLFKVEMTIRDLDKYNLGSNAIADLVLDQLAEQSMQVLSITVTELEEPNEPTKTKT